MNGLEKKLDGTAEVVRINLLSTLGKEIGGRFGVKSANTSILINGKGDVVYNHSGIPDRKKIIAEASKA